MAQPTDYRIKEVKRWCHFMAEQTAGNITAAKELLSSRYLLSS